MNTNTTNNTTITISGKYGKYAGEMNAKFDALNDSALTGYAYIGKRINDLLASKGKGNASDYLAGLVFDGGATIKPAICSNYGRYTSAVIIADFIKNHKDIDATCSFRDYTAIASCLKNEEIAQKIIESGKLPTKAECNAYKGKGAKATTSKGKAKSKADASKDAGKIDNATGKALLTLARDLSIITPRLKACNLSGRELDAVREMFGLVGMEF